MTEREAPDVGTYWMYTHETRTYDYPIKIKVTEVSGENVVVTEIQSEKFLEEQVESIEKTYEKNGHNLDNAEEVVPFATYNGETGEFESTNTEIFYSLEEFYDHCEKAV
jgi:hypothetical protein